MARTEVNEAHMQQLMDFLDRVQGMGAYRRPPHVGRMPGRTTYDEDSLQIIDRTYAGEVGEKMHNLRWCVVCMMQAIASIAAVQQRKLEKSTFLGDVKAQLVKMKAIQPTFKDGGWSLQEVQEIFESFLLCVYAPWTTDDAQRRADPEGVRAIYLRNAPFMSALQGLAFCLGLKIRYMKDTYTQNRRYYEDETYALKKLALAERERRRREPAAGAAGRGGGGAARGRRGRQTAQGMTSVRERLRVLCS